MVYQQNGSAPWSMSGCIAFAEANTQCRASDLQGLGSPFLAATPFSLYAVIDNRSRASLRSRVSKTQPAWGSTRAACQVSCVSRCTLKVPSWSPTSPSLETLNLKLGTIRGGRGRQAMHLPCKQAHAGAFELPVPPPVSCPGHGCSLREMWSRRLHLFSE